MKTHQFIYNIRELIRKYEESNGVEVTDIKIESRYFNAISLKERPKRGRFDVSIFVKEV